MEVKSSFDQRALLDFLWFLLGIPLCTANNNTLYSKFHFGAVDNLTLYHMELVDLIDRYAYTYGGREFDVNVIAEGERSINLNVHRTAHQFMALIPPQNGKMTY